MTSTYVEGQAPRNPQAQRDYSRDHRPDCKQVCIALVVTFDGFPLGYEVFAGNTHDSRTVQTIVSTMEARHGMLGRVWIADRGMASAANLTWLRETGRRYIVGAPKSELKRCAAELAAPDGWRVVQEGVEVKLARDANTAETVILCRSADRRSKEQVMHDRFSRRLSPACGPQRRIRRLGGAVGRRLSAALQHRRVERPATLEGLHSAHPSGSGVPHSERSAQRPTDLAPARRPTSSSASSPSCCGNVWRCGRAAPVSATRRGPFWRSWVHSVARRGATHRDARVAPTALCHPVRRRTGRAARSPRSRAAEAGSRVHERWARLRFSVIGQLLSSPPARGALFAALAQLAAHGWRHPRTGVHFAGSVRMEACTASD